MPQKQGDGAGVPQEHASIIAVLKTENAAPTARKAGGDPEHLVLGKVGGDPE